MHRTFVELRKELLEVLQRHKELSPHRLEVKLNTSTQTIKEQVKDLESLGFITVTEHTAHPKNNKPYKTCSITPEGLAWLKKQKE